MAELNTAGPQPKGKGKVRSKKMNTFVDLTAMVDLAFLLITFFMLTTTLSKPQSMNLAMPDKSEPDAEETRVTDYRTITILLGADDQIVWYMGLFDSPLEGPEVVGFGRNGIRQVLLDQARQVLTRTQDTERGLIAIIKPSEDASYRNFVDILDEMIITHVRTYAVVDITPLEVELLQNKLN